MVRTSVNLESKHRQNPSFGKEHSVVLGRTRSEGQTWKPDFERKGADFDLFDLL